MDENKKDKRKNIIILILVLIIALGGFFLFNRKDDEKPLDVDTEQSSYVKPEKPVDRSKNVTLPGWGAFNIPANTKEITQGFEFHNPEENFWYVDKMSVDGKEVEDLVVDSGNKVELNHYLKLNGIDSEVKSVGKYDKDFSVTGVLSKLHLSKSGYYNYLHRKPSKQSISKKNRIQAIRTIYDDNHQIYGAPKIAKEMQKKGEKISQRTVGVYMREMGIRACYIKPYVKTTFDSDFSTKLHNILKRDFSPSKPNEAWCTDITYIFTLEGFVYLTSVMDLYSRKIIAWTLSKTLEVEEVLKCIELAIKQSDENHKKRYRHQRWQGIKMI